jgi:predicted AlkP superfamily pyrophosphatase or phosphodiesterase
MPKSAMALVRILFALAVSAATFSLVSLPALATQPPSPSDARPLVVIAVFDGLRPDSVTAEDMPTLFRLRREGVSYRTSHSTFPTVTRVNGATLSTGTYPQRHGLVSNSMFVPAVNPTAPFSTGEWEQLAKLRDASHGRLLFTKTLAEILKAQGLTFVAASSGSTGSAFVMNPLAPDGVGTLISAGFEPGKRVAFPDSVSEAILRRFGPAPSEEGAKGMDWTERVLREYVVPELHPDVLMDWLTETDGAQHAHGAGSPEGRAAARNSDRNLGLLLDTLAARGLTGRVNVIVTSDHGFSRHERAVNFTQALIRAGLKTSPTSDDVVLASNSQAVLVHVKERNADRIRKIVAFLQSHEDVDVIFTRAAPTQSRPLVRALPVHGWVPGTFALELAHAANDARGADILFSLRWSSAKNRFGVPGAQVVHSESREGALDGDASGHGGLSPWTVNNTLILWGPSFKQGLELDAPAGTVDIAPTTLALLGVATDTEFDGRVLREALRSGADLPSAPRWSETVTAKQGNYAATLRISGVGDRWYLDQGARVRK